MFPIVTRHIQEIEMIRGKVYSLEQQHQQMKAKYVSLAGHFRRVVLP
jgi:glucose repression regulatory protein TUP1